MMDLSSTWINNNLVITITQSRLNQNIGPRVIQAVAENPTPLSANIILDFSQVIRVDSTGLAGILVCYKCIQGKGELRVCGANNSIKQMLENARLDQILSHCQTVEEALCERSPQ